MQLISPRFPDWSAAPRGLFRCAITCQTFPVRLSILLNSAGPMQLTLIAVAEYAAFR